METEKKESLSLPLAIVAAGIIIAIAVFLTRSGGTLPNNTNNNQVNTNAAAAVSTVALPPITEKDHIIGNPSAPVTLVEYSDLECPACKFFQPILRQMMDNYGKNGQVAWVFRHYPIKELHPKAHKEAEASECVNELGGNTKFWAYIDKIFDVTPANNGLDPAQLPKIAVGIGIDQKKFETCLASGKYSAAIDESIKEGSDIGVGGTPTSFLSIRNPLTKDAIDRVRAKMTPFVQNGTQLVSISDDGKIVTISAAFQYDGVKEILDAVLAEAK